MSMTPFELFLSDEVQSLLDHFAATLDIRVTFFSADGRTLRRGRQMRNSDYCRMVQRELGTLRQCVSLDADKQQEAVQQRGIIDYQCHAGLREAIAPVFIHDQLAGFLMIGQFRINDAPPECMLERCSSEEQRRKLEQSFRELPRISAEKLENVLGLFKMLIDYIVVRELAVLQGDRLRNDIDRYLERHCTEPIRLPEMAKKLGRSVSTISQFLRRNYRTSFKELLTDFGAVPVSGKPQPLEQIGNGLCRFHLVGTDDLPMANPDATVGETAFAAGFSDQFYFSRVFKRHKGMPPGEFRARLRRHVIR